MKKPHQSEAGFSLVGILIIMGVVLTSILLISQARFQQQGAQKALKMKQSYTDINQTLITDVVQNIHTSLKASSICMNPTSLQAKPLNGAVKYSVTSSIAGFNSQAPKLHSDAKARCQSISTPTVSGNRFYFCAQMTKDDTAPKDSIMNARVAFAEFAIELIDLQTQQPLTCQKYNEKASDTKDGSAGMAVTMALYWENDIGAQKSGGGGGKSSFSQKAMSYIANQND